jgi:hypothetical protein
MLAQSDSAVVASRKNKIINHQIINFPADDKTPMDAK